MKHYKTFLLLLVAIFAIGNVYAYEQKGYVKTIGRPGKKGQRIANVSIYPKEGQGNSTNSDVNGDFSLPIKSKSFYINKITKTGYEPADADLLSTQFVCSANPLIILLANSAELREERNKVSRKLYDNLNQKLKEQQEKLDKLLNEKKISEEKYREEINLLYSKYDKNDALVREMAEKYSKLDFDQLNYFDQKVSELIMNGNLTEADSILRTKGDINQRRKELDALNTANDEVRNNLEKSEAVAKAQAEELATDYFHHFEICKLSFEFDSAAYYIKERASLFNSTNIDFLNEAGDFFRDYACIYDEALLFYEKALEQTKKEYGENHVDAATSYNNIASIYKKQGKYDEALERYNKALDIWKSILSENHVDVALSYNNIASVYDTQGKYNEALELYNKALNILKSILGENHVCIATSYNNIAMVYDKQGKYDEALELYNKALDILKPILSENHVYVATSYNNIASVYDKQGKYDEALELYNKALDIYKSTLGENHVDVATSYNIIASAYYLQGKYDEALELYYKALNIYKSILGDNHVDVANSYISIALILGYNGNFTNALEYFNKALEILMLNPEENKKYIELIIEFTTQLEQLINSNDSN